MVVKANLDNSCHTLQNIHLYQRICIIGLSEHFSTDVPFVYFLEKKFWICHGTHTESLSKQIYPYPQDTPNSYHLEPTTVIVCNHERIACAAVFN